MKNFKSCSEHAILVHNSASLKRKGERYKRNRPSSSDFIERSVKFLQNYNTLFKKSAYLFGNTDTYFKKSLRNYSDFQISPNSFSRRSKPDRTNKRKLKQLGQGDHLEVMESADNEGANKTPDEKENEQEVALEGNEEDTNEAIDSNKKQGGDEVPLAENKEEKKAHDEKKKDKKKEASDFAEMERELDIPQDDKAILKEVEECEAQCMEIYNFLSELKNRVGELLNKPQRTPQEEKELESKQKLLNEKMALLEQKTRRIELLVGKTKKPDYDKPYDEDTLPKVVVCGLADNNMPKFIICDDKKRRNAERKPPCSPLTGMAKTCPLNKPLKPLKPLCPITQSKTYQPIYPAHPPCLVPPGVNQSLPPPCLNVMPQFAQKLSESYEMQERLAQENADLEGKRYKLHEDLLNKDQTVDSLQRQLTSLQTELRLVVKENGLLNSKLQQVQFQSPCKRIPSLPGTTCSRSSSPCTPRQKPCNPSGDTIMPCGKGRPCPAKVEEMETKKLEKQLNEMEAEVKAIQNELSTVRQERIHLEQHRRMLTSPPPPPCITTGRPDNTQLKELREQYNTLQDDYKSKLIEVSGLRADVDKLKVAAQESADLKKALEEKVKDLERQLKEFKGDKKGSTKEQITELEQQLLVAKQRFRDAQDELEELRALTEDQQNQVLEYRNKYLEAQQQVEEQKRQIDLMELENNRIGEQVNLEIQRVKNQFQEKLQELTPLPDILKATQIKLQEAQQMHLIAERNNEALLREIQTLTDRASAYADEMERTRSNQMMGQNEKMGILEKNAELEKKVEEMTEEMNRIQNFMEELQEVADDAEKRAQEKLHEIAQLNAEVENVREESARQVSRTKDRCETIRRSMQNQIADLEKQLAQSRAQAKAAQKDRDEIRQKMQTQINNLNDNFEDAQMRIRALQGHVNILKNSAAVYPSAEHIQPIQTCSLRK